MNRPVSLYQQAGKGNDDKTAMTYFQRAVPEWIDSQSYVLKKNNDYAFDVSKKNRKHFTIKKIQKLSKVIC